MGDNIINPNVKDEEKAIKILNDDDVEDDRKEYEVLRLSNSSATRRQIYEEKIGPFNRPADKIDTIGLILQDIAKDDIDHRDEFDELYLETVLQPEGQFSRFERNKSHPCFIDALRISQHSPGNPNRFVQSTRPLNVGEKIVVSKPFAWAMPNNITIPYCLTCGIINVPLSPCRECSRAFFCSLLCQLSNKTHKYECTSVFHSDNMDVDTKLAIQMVLETFAAFDDDLDDIFREFYVQVDNGARHRVPAKSNNAKSKFICILHLAWGLEPSQDRVRRAHNILMGLQRINEICDTELKREFLHHVLSLFDSILRCNGLSIEYATHSAKALYDAVSFFNHSCSPNVGTRFKGINMDLVA